MASDLTQKFVTELLKQAGLENMPEEFKNDYLEKLSVAAEERVGLSTLKELSPQDMEEFMNLSADNAAPQALADFLKEKIPDYEAKVTAALQEFAKEFTASAEKLKTSSQ